MKHFFEVPLKVFEDLRGTRRHLFVKDSAKYATGDTAIIQAEDDITVTAVHREQLELEITMIEHGPDSKHVNGHYALLGLYAAYPEKIVDLTDTTIGHNFGNRERLK